MLNSIIRFALTVFLFPVFYACNDGHQTAKTQQIPAPVITDTLSGEKAEPEMPHETTESYVAAIIAKREEIKNKLAGISQNNAIQLYQSLALYADTALKGISSNESGLLDNYVNWYSEKEQVHKPPAAAQLKLNLLATAGIEPWYIGEGYTEFRYIPHFYTDLFRESLPADYSKFLQLKADEDTVLYSADAGLMISFNQVGKRVLNWEAFLDAYPKSVFFAEARELYVRYLDDYLFGQDNTSSFDDREDVNSMVPENRQEYLSFIENNGKTKSAALAKVLLDMIPNEKSVSSLKEKIRANIDLLYSTEKRMTAGQ